MLQHPQMKFSAKRKLVKFYSNPFIHRIMLFMKRLVLPGFQKIPFWDVMKFFVESLIRGIIFQRAAAMTYYIFIAAIPLFMALIATVSFLSASIQDNLIAFITSAVPEYVLPSVERIINDLILRQNGVILWLSLGFGVYLTFLSVNAIVNTLNITYFDMEQRTLPKQILVSFTMVFVFFITIITASGIFFGTSYLLYFINDEFIGSIQFYTYSLLFFKWAFLFVLLYLFLSALFYFAPYNKKYFKFFSVGSIFSTLSLVVLLYALNFYFSHFSKYNLIYGSIGAILLIMLWLYWTSIVILIGFDLNVSICIARQNSTNKLKIKSSIVK